MSSENSFIMKSDLLTYVGNFGYSRLACPVLSPVSASEVEFKGFGIAFPGDNFNLGWFLGIQEISDAKFLQAFCTGTVFFERGTDKHRMVLYNGELLGSVLWKDEVPDWFPTPEITIYENIDEILTREILKIYLESNTTLFNSINKDSIFSDVDTFLDSYFNNATDIGIPVDAGIMIGVAGAGINHNREVSIFIQQEENSALYLDPAIFHEHWGKYFSDLSGHQLSSSFTCMFGPMIANGVVRYVGSSGSLTGDFLDFQNPASEISIAVEAANDYDTVLILDTGNVNHGGRYLDNLVITKPISISFLNPNCLDVINIPSLDTFNWPALAIISGSSEGGSVIDISEVDGYVSISNLIITGGFCNNRNSNGVQGGGGILAYYSEKVYISNCLIIQNKVDSEGSLNGHGGGVYCYSSSSYIYRCNISSNEAGDRGAGIFAGMFAWPVIRNCNITNNLCSGTRADGGGIGATISMPGTLGYDANLLDKSRNTYIRIFDNTISDNTAQDDGGGIYLSVMSKAIFRRNMITNNIAWKAGGGVRISMGSDIYMEEDLVSENKACFRHFDDPEELQNGGGGIASRDGDLVLNKVIISNNINYGFAGGGIFLSSSEEGEITEGEDEVEGWLFYLASGVSSFDDIMRDKFLKTEVRISISADTIITENISSKYPNSDDTRKGGGVYLLRFRDDDFTSLPLVVEIQNFTLIGGNLNNKISEITGGFGQNLTNDPQGPLFPDSDQFYLHDMVDEQLPPAQQQLPNGVIDTVTAISFLDTNNTLIYVSL